MSKFDNRRVTILGPHPMQGHCGVTGELQEPESERPWITVKLENREEVTISDPMQLLFPDGLGVPAPSSPSSSLGCRFAPSAEPTGETPNLGPTNAAPRGAGRYRFRIITNNKVLAARNTLEECAKWGEENPSDGHECEYVFDAQEHMETPLEEVMDAFARGEKPLDLYFF